MRLTTRLSIFGFGLATLLGPAAAAAADLSPLVIADPVVVDEMFDWTGLYAGVQVGIVAGEVESEDYFCIITTDCYTALGDRYFSSIDLAGFKGGVHLGYDQQFGMLVLGAETDLNVGDGSHDGGYLFYDSVDDETRPGNEDESAAFDLAWQGSSRVRLGLALDRFMPYATGGIAYGQASGSDHREFDDGADHSYANINLVGYTVGLGAAYALTDDIIIRGEGRFTDFGTTTVVGNDGDGESHPIELVGPAIASFEAGVSFKF